MFSIPRKLDFTGAGSYLVEFIGQNENVGVNPNQSQEIMSLFEKAGNNAKVMCVPIDYAQNDHVALFCNGNGDVLRKPFSVKNTPSGVRYLIDQVKRSCQHRGIDKQNVFFDGTSKVPFCKNI